MANESQNILQGSPYGRFQKQPEKQIIEPEEETINIPDSSSIEAPSEETLAAEAFDKEMALAKKIVTKQFQKNIRNGLNMKLKKKK